MKKKVYNLFMQPITYVWYLPLIFWILLILETIQTRLGLLSLVLVFLPLHVLTLWDNK